MKLSVCILLFSTLCNSKAFTLLAEFDPLVEKTFKDINGLGKAFRNVAACLSNLEQAFKGLASAKDLNKALKRLEKDTNILGDALKELAKTSIRIPAKYFGAQGNDDASQRGFNRNLTTLMSNVKKIFEGQFSEFFKGQQRNSQG